jgi:hypothetical protein
MTEKKFHIPAEAIKPLVEDAGSCYATDRIMVEGSKVGYFYREAPANDMDSGWRFFAGDEDDAYLEKDENIGVYGVNTVANYDESILPLIYSPVGSAFERHPESGEFEAVDSPVDPDDCLHPDVPIVEEDYALSDAWRITLPAKFNRRVEEGALVLWRPGLTLYFIAWNNDHDDSIEKRLGLLKADLSPKAFDPREEVVDGVPRYSYRLVEEGVNVLYGFVVDDSGHLQVAISFDDEADLDVVYALFASVA